jgi:hypothetical protein
MAGRTPWIGDRPIEWDALRLKYNAEGEPAPGVATVEVDRSYKADEKDPNGANGATITLGGEKLAKVSITLTLWNERHFRRMDAFLDALFPGGTAKATPFDVAHPVLTHHRLKSLIFLSYSGPKNVGDDIFEIHLEAKEFKPPPPTPPASAINTPTSAKGGGASVVSGASGQSTYGPKTFQEFAWVVAYNNWKQGRGPHPGPAPRENLLAAIPAGPPLPPSAPKA